MSDNINEQLEIVVKFDRKEQKFLYKELKKTLRIFQKNGYRSQFPDNFNYLRQIKTMLSHGKTELTLHARHCSTLGGYCDAAYFETGQKIFEDITLKMSAAINKWESEHPKQTT